MAHAQALQIIDANLNRLREGIRVAEDILRYTTGAEQASRKLKQLRLAAGNLEQELRRATGHKLAGARRIERDSGKGRTPPQELERGSLEALLAANLNRAQEAARAVEELVKLAGLRACAQKYKRLRFALYAVETEGLTLLSRLSRQRVFREALRKFPLYLVVDELNTESQSPLRLVAGYHRAGGRVVQLRMKHLSAQPLLRLGCELPRMFPDLLLIVNDRGDVAMSAGAFGVHLGRQDLPLAAMREIRGDLLVGFSASAPLTARRAVSAGADYIGVGAIFPTESKSHMRMTGLAGLREVASAVEVPVIAIGGITKDNFAKVLRAGAEGLAVISAVATSGSARRLYAAVRKWARE